VAEGFLKDALRRCVKLWASLDTCAGNARGRVDPRGSERAREPRYERVLRVSAAGPAIVRRMGQTPRGRPLGVSAPQRERLATPWA